MASKKRGAGAVTVVKAKGWRAAYQNDEDRSDVVVIPVAGWTSKGKALVACDGTDELVRAKQGPSWTGNFLGLLEPGESETVLRDIAKRSSEDEDKTSAKDMAAIDVESLRRDLNLSVTVEDAVQLGDFFGRPFIASPSEITPKFYPTRSAIAAFVRLLHWRENRGTEEGEGTENDDLNGRITLMRETIRSLRAELNASNDINMRLAVTLKNIDALNRGKKIDTTFTIDPYEPFEGPNGETLYRKKNVADVIESILKGATPAGGGA